MKNIILSLTIITTLSFFSCCGIYAQEKEWINGTWIGIGYQLDTKTSWQIKLTCNTRLQKFTIDYPTLSCNGNWKPTSMDAQTARFTEVITEGTSNCVNGGSVVITKIDKNYITYSYFAPYSEELGAYATLIKVDDTALQSTNAIKRENNSCENLYFDLDRGTLNGLKGGASQAEIKQALPCFTGASPDGSEYNCGGGVFFLEHDFYFYSGQDYIEIRHDFPGKMSTDILHKSPTGIEKALGLPDRTEKIRKYDGTVRTHYFYEKKYGCLSIVFIKNKIAKIAMHSTSLH